MAAFRRILFTAALAGLLTGLGVTAVQSWRVIPLILEAETYERAVSPGGQRPPAGTPWAAPRRLAFTALANSIAAMGFGLLLAAGFSLTGGASVGVGLLWGLAGFAAFSLAPALGLPPELPGTRAAALHHRQLWWLLTAALTAGGLALLVFAGGMGWKLLGGLLLALPHLAGAPRPLLHGGTAPLPLQHAFVAASLFSSALLWLVLGGLAGFIYQRLGRA